MYKVVYYNTIIDVLDDVKYLKYVPKVGRLIKTAMTTADCCYSSNKKEVYIIGGIDCPQGKTWKKVELLPVGEFEADKLKRLIRTEVVCADVNEINKVRAEKIAEMSACCKDAICSGVRVLFSDGAYHHFKLTIEDQLNLHDLEKQIAAGYKKVVYHETNLVCTTYHSADIAKLIDAANKHKQYHTTYFNVLKHAISVCRDVEKIKSITYGIELDKFDISDDLKKLLKR